MADDDLGNAPPRFDDWKAWVHGQFGWVRAKFEERGISRDQLESDIRQVEKDVAEIKARLGTLEILTRGSPSVPATKMASLLIHDTRAMLIVAVVIGIILGNAGITPQKLLVAVVGLLK